MTHLRFAWRPDPLEESDMVEVDVLIAFNDRAPVKHAGAFRAHATDLQRIVRALELGETFERPGFTFEVAQEQMISSYALRLVSDS